MPIAAQALLSAFWHIPAEKRLVAVSTAADNRESVSRKFDWIVLAESQYSYVRNGSALSPRKEEGKNMFRVSRRARQLAKSAKYRSRPFVGVLEPNRLISATLKTLILFNDNN